jgi:hypothetical protein
MVERLSVLVNEVVKFVVSGDKMRGTTSKVRHALSVRLKKTSLRALSNPKIEVARWLRLVCMPGGVYPEGQTSYIVAVTMVTYLSRITWGNTIVRVVIYAVDF